MPAASPSAVRSLSALRRWLRHSWISRLPLLGWLRRPAKPQLPPAKAKRPPHEAELLETRFVPNDPFALAQAAWPGLSLAALFGNIPTPAQVLMGG